MTTETNTAPDSNINIARKATSAIIWNYLSFFLGKVLVFITIAILARLLTPKEVGIVALAMIAINYFTVVQDLGLGAALIQRTDRVEEAAHTVFTLNLIFGAFVTAVVFLLAPLLASYFREDMVTPILRWLGLSFIINAFGVTHTIRLRRQLDFRSKIIPDLGRSIAKGVFSISLALGGYGVWSLVYGQLVGTIVFVFLAWWVVPWRPKLQIHMDIARPMLRYGFSVLIGDSISDAIDNLDYFIVGRVFGNVALGIYSYAYRLPELLIINNLWVMSSVMFPTYATFQNNYDDLRKAFLGTILFLEILVTPICLGLVIAADPLVRVAFGNQWLETIPVIRILAIYALVLSVGYHAGGVYKAIGRPDIPIKLSIITLIILFPCLLIGSNYGLIGVAVGHVVAVAIRATLRLIVARRLIHVSYMDILLQLKPAAQSGLGLVVLALPTLYLCHSLPALLQLLVISLSGAVGYMGTLWLFERETIMKIIQLVGAKRLKQAPAVV
jgi:O-antigen/teichoic acid export membrane protein